MRQPIRQHLADMARLAAPVVLSRTGLMTMAVVNLAFLGRIAVDEVAFMAAAGVPLTIILVACNGLTTGTLVMASHAYGRGDLAEAGRVWRRSLPFAALVGFLGGFLCLGGEWVLRATGQDAKVATGAAEVLHILGFSLPGNALFLTTAFFLEAIKRPMPAVVVIVVANLLNAGLNLLLVFGEPAMGAVGSAIATSAARWFMALALIAYALLMPGHGLYAVRDKVAGWWRDSATARQIGYASGVSAALEASAFGSMTIFAGWFGAPILAAYAIALNAWSLVFMSAIGLGIGAAVRVGHAAGAGDRPGMREAGWVALAIAFIVMTPISVSFDVFRDKLAAIFTKDPALLADSAAMLAMCAWVILMDSGKTVMLQAVRGTGDTWVPTRAQFVLVFGVMVPCAYVLAFPLGFGPSGLFLGMLAAATGSLLFLCWRFWMRSR